MIDFSTDFPSFLRFFTEFDRVTFRQLWLQLRRDHQLWQISLHLAHVIDL